LATLALFSRRKFSGIAAPGVTPVRGECDGGPNQARTEEAKEDRRDGGGGTINPLSAPLSDPLFHLYKLHGRNNLDRLVYLLLEAKGATEQANCLFHPTPLPPSLR
jgi:hypothetical protein